MIEQIKFLDLAVCAITINLSILKIAQLGVYKTGCFIIWLVKEADRSFSIFLDFLISKRSLHAVSKSVEKKETWIVVNMFKRLLSCVFLSV